MKECFSRTSLPNSQVIWNKVMKISIRSGGQNDIIKLIINLFKPINYITGLIGWRSYKSEQKIELYRNNEELCVMLIACY